MIFFRIVRSTFDRPAIAFNGEAASQVAHRWNHPASAIRAVYGADSLALACLEILVHVRPLALADLPPSLYYHLDVPDRLLETPGRDALPDGWDSRVAGDASRDFGMAFLRERRAVGLVVPTVIQPLGHNVLLNVLHPSFDLGWVRGPFPYLSDRRLA